MVIKAIILCKINENIRDEFDNPHFFGTFVFKMEKIILGIESSCDDTSAAVVADGVLISNVIASQKVHESYGGVVPELASRAHQQNIVPVVSEALSIAGIKPTDLSAIAYTRGPGLIGSLLVGSCFAKGMAIGLEVPLIEVNHLQAHALSAFIRDKEEEEVPAFPYMTLLVSGGNSQIIWVKSPFEMQMLGTTIDDAAGEAFDKCGKVLGLPYPAGPHIDRLSKEGNSKAFKFSKPHIPDLNYSFSGLKTSFLYTLRDHIKNDPDFIERNQADLAASLQNCIVEILMDKLQKAVKIHRPKHLSIGGGVAANSGIRNAVRELCDKYGVSIWLPPLKYTTDNAAMVATAGYFSLLGRNFSNLSKPPFAKVKV